MHDYVKVEKILDRWFSHCQAQRITRPEYYLGFEVAIRIIREDLQDLADKELAEMFQDDAQRNWMRLSEKMKKDLTPVIEVP